MRPSTLRRLAFLALLTVAGCASADEVSRFRDTDYQERKADPGKVDEVCYGDGKGHLDNGLRKSWDDSYCGCVDFDAKVVWLARSIKCDHAKTRDHEYCHIILGPSPEARKVCDAEF